MEADHHRIVMTTELGNKLLDLQFKNDVFTENFVIEELDRKMILNVLKADFRLLLMEKSLVLNSYDSETQHVYQTQRDNRYNRSEEHTSELQSRPHLVCRLLLEKKK